MESADGMFRAVASPPWRGMRGSYAADGPSNSIPSLHHRGWTLVDVGRSRYASEDATGRRVRVCGAFEDHAEAIRRFRAAVDGEIDG